MRIRFLAFIVLAICCGGCSHSRIRMDIATKNESPLDLDWVEVDWDGPGVPGGVLSRGIWKTTIDVGPPKSDVAIITFIEATSRKPHTNRVDVSRLKRLAPGFYEVTFSILTVNSVELRIRERKDR